MIDPYHRLCFDAAGNDSPIIDSPTSEEGGPPAFTFERSRKLKHAARKSGWVGHPGMIV